MIKPGKTVKLHRLQNLSYLVVVVEMVQLYKQFNLTKCTTSLNGSIAQTAQSNLSGLTI